MKAKTPNANSILRPYQMRWLQDSAQLKLWVAARQIGKSFVISLEAVLEALKAKSDQLILSASERQSREVMHKVVMHLRFLHARTAGEISPIADNKSEVDLENGSRIISLPASPNTVRGFSGNVFLDEFAFHEAPEEIWKAMYPMTTGGYKLRISSTPNGRSNLFYRLATQENKLSKHRTDIYQAVKEGLKVNIQDLREGLADPDAWSQEYECNFLDEATAYLTYDMIASCEDDGAAKDGIGPIGLMGPIGPMHGNEFYLGVDIGRKKDLTVFWLWEKVGDVFWSRMVKEMRNAPFKAQEEFLHGMLGNEGMSHIGHTGPVNGNPNIRRCCIDATGIGAQMAEEAVRRFGPMVEAVTFTGKVKEDLAVTMRRKFEDRQVRIPADREIREDFHSVRKFTTSAGNVRFDAERTEAGHADRFWAAALGLHAGGGPAPVIEFEAIGGGTIDRQMGGWGLVARVKGY